MAELGVQGSLCGRAWQPLPTGHRAPRQQERQQLQPIHIDIAPLHSNDTDSELDMELDSEDELSLAADAGEDDTQSDAMDESQHTAFDSQHLEAMSLTISKWSASILNSIENEEVAATTKFELESTVVWLRSQAQALRPSSISGSGLPESERKNMLPSNCCSVCCSLETSAVPHP